MTCGICIENFNKSSRKLVKCVCNYECCTSCAKHYLLSIKEDAHCMNCKIAWDRNFLVNNFEVKFINTEYKKHREDVLMEREMTLMPSTQIYVEQEIKLEELQKRRKEIKKQIHELCLEDYNISVMINDIRYGIDKNTQRNEFIRKCPNGDCRGFLTSNLKCGICNIWACGDCREVKGLTRDSEHQCNPEIVESIKALDKETRTCPKCSYRIYRIEGCSQMYCSPEFGGCGTAFCWNTGKIETQIHNPHYFEYLRKTNNGFVERNPNDIICGRELDNNFVRMLSSQTYASKKILDITRNIQHIRFMDLPKYTPRDRNQGNLDLRIKYMRQEIDKTKMKVLIQRREKENMKKREITNVINMFINSMIDIIYRYYYEGNSQKYQNAFKLQNIFLKEMNSLREYTNECFKNISNTYKCVELSIHDSFELQIE